MEKEMSEDLKQLNIMKDHAETFDVNFIQRKTYKIYCFSETLIYDYFILKAITTRSLHIVVVTNGKNDFKLTKGGLLDRINMAALTDKLVRHTLSNQLKFRNNSRIQILNYDFSNNSTGGRNSIHLLYIKNTALSRLYYTLAFSNFSDLLNDKNGRIIYNFDV